VKCLRPGGEEQFFDQQVHPVRDAAGRCTGLMGIGLDVTERVRAEQLLRRSEEGLKLMIAHSTEPMLLVNEDGVIEGASAVGVMQLGFAETEVVGRNAEQFLDWSSKLDIVFRLRDFRQYAPRPARATLRIRTGDGAWCWMDVTASFVNFGQKPEKFLVKFERIDLEGSSEAIPPGDREQIW